MSPASALRSNGYFTAQSSNRENETPLHLTGYNTSTMRGAHGHSFRDQIREFTLKNDRLVKLPASYSPDKNLSDEIEADLKTVNKKNQKLFTLKIYVIYLRLFGFSHN